MLAMGARLVKSLTLQCMLSHTEPGKSYHFVDMISQSTKAAVKALATAPETGSSNTESAGQIQRDYLDALCAILSALMRGRLNTFLVWNPSSTFEFKGNPQNAALMAAAYLGRIDHVENLLALGAELEVARPTASESAWVHSALLSAALGGQVGVLDFLKKRGVSFDGPLTSMGENAAFFCCAGRASECIQVPDRIRRGTVSLECRRGNTAFVGCGCRACGRCEGGGKRGTCRCGILRPKGW
ncbi:hypothetical protein BJY04DRAFT_9019 [Aspergillus karnatakaensis]|uniref:uncharacterized protein n=1 Tax=Aspergillus karnatakaensis TaxID=1810916 RepID=UPI003CCDFF43